MPVKKNIKSDEDILKYSELKVVDSVIILKFNSPIEDVEENTRSSNLVIQKMTEILDKNPGKYFCWLIDLTTVGKMKNMPSFSRKNYAEFAKNIPLSLKYDPDLTEIILQNLLSNAIKYTPPFGKIKLEVKKIDKKILIKISDNGYGIPRKQQNRIFEKLFRADNVKQKDTDGTGLGLYIVKMVVEEVGGMIWFESKENVGTTFYVTLPASGMKRKKGTKTLV